MESEQRMDYLGFAITWAKTRTRANGWQVELSSSSPRLLAKLGGQAKVFSDPNSLDRAIQKAQQDVDEVFLCLAEG